MTMSRQSDLLKLVYTSDELSNGSVDKVSYDKAQLNYMCVHTSYVSIHCKCDLQIGAIPHMSSD